MISIIIPFYNEKENIPILIPELSKALEFLGQPFEIVLVDDGSTDNYMNVVTPILTDPRVKLEVLNRQMGKGKALEVGIEKSHGDIITFMDADLQDDPGDLSLFLEKINNGYHFVNGHRFDRQDNLLIKVYSKTARWFLRKFLNSPFTDINCGFKMFRREILDNVVLYGNTFRFLPLAAFYEGFRVGEVVVHNKPRIHGKSKFGISKLFIGVIDMSSAFFLYKFSEKPLHFFGSIGAVFFGIGGIMLAWLTYDRIFMGALLYKRPALSYATLFVILGIQIIMTGILGELVVYLKRKKV